MRTIFETSLVRLILLSALVAGCATKVERVDRTEMVDISGDWNDYDAMLVSKEMVDSALQGPWLTTFVEEEKRQPIVIVGYVSNRSAEHLDSQVFVKYLERELMNSGKVIFVASAEERQGLRAERDDMQQGYTLPESIKAMGKEKGADLMLIGSVSSIQDSEDNRSAVFYQVNLELVDLESNVKVWMGQKEIKKIVTRPRFSF